MNLTGFARRLVTPVVATAVLASGLAAPNAAAAEPGITPEQLASAVFSAAVQLKDNGRTHDRNLLLSAELLDWRAKNPAATADALNRHAADVERVVGLAVAPATERDLVPDTLGRGVEALYAVPEVDKGGKQLKTLLGALTKRDLKSANSPEELRGVLQQFTVSSIEIAPTIWTALREAAGRDATLNSTWKTRLGKATVAETAAVDPVAPLDTLKQLPQVKKVIDVDAIQAGFQQGFKQGMEALNKQIKPLIKVLGDPNSPNTPLGQAMQWVKDHVDQNTGEIKKPSEQELKDFEEQAKKFDTYLDYVKGGLTAFATVAKVLSPRYAADLVKFADTLYKIGKHVLPMINAVAALGTAIAAGAAIGSIVPAIGTVIGAAVGLITTLVGLLGSGGGGPSPELQAIQGMHTEMRESFKQLKDFLIAFQTQVNSRFDRIDATLNLMYGDMLMKFDQVLIAIAQSNFQLTQQIKDLHSALLTIATNFQGDIQAILAGMQADAATPFRNAIRKYVDYAARENRPIPSYDQGNDTYKFGAEAYSDAGDDLARSAVFMREPQDVPPAGILATNNPTALVNYLTKWAEENFGPQYGHNKPAAGTPNATLLAAAMRAYAVLMDQNPALAAQEPLVDPDGDGKFGVARVDDLLKAGGDVVGAARRFNQPRFKPTTGPWVATNSLLGGLQEENSLRMIALANSLKKYEFDSTVQEPTRPFSLWGDRNQPVEGFMKRDDVEVQHCYTPTGETGLAAMPELIKSDKLPAPVRVLKQLHPTMELRTCWATVSAMDHSYGRYDLDGPTRIPCKWSPDPPVGCTKSVTQGSTKLVRINVEFQVRGVIPGQTNETALARMSGVGTVERCRYPGVQPHDDEPLDGSCTMNPVDFFPRMKNAPKYEPQGTMTEDDTYLSYPRISKTLAERRARYYALVANDLKDAEPKLPEAKAVDTNLRLLRAYLELGFPTALQSDERLRSLLYGDRAVPSSLNVRKIRNEISPLAALFSKAAQNQLAEKDALHEQKVFSQAEIPGCTAAPAEVTTPDPVARCLVTIGGQRRGALGERIEYYSTDLVANPAAQDPQTITALMRSLRIQTKATHPNYVLDPPGEPNPVPPAEIGKTVGGLGGSSRATLGGKHFMVWQGKQDEVLVATSADGKAWWPPVTVAGPHTAGEVPAITAFRDKLVAAWQSGPFSWKDGNNERTIAVSTSTDGKTWTEPVRLAPIPLATGGIGLTVHNDQLHLLFKGADQGKYLTVSHDGKNWKRPQQVVNNGATAAAPGLASLNNGTLAQLWRGGEGDEALYTAFSNDGVTWANQKVLDAGAARSPVAPSLTVHNNKVFAVWRNAANDGLSVSDTGDGANWVAPRALHAQAHALGTPSLGVVGGKLAAIWRDAVDTNRVSVSTSADGITWSAPEAISKLTAEARHQHNEALLTEATRLWNRGEREQAVVKAKEALQFTRELVRESPGYAATLAQWIRTPVSGYLAETGRHDEAITLLDEAIALYRRLSVYEPQKFEHKLSEADTLVWQGTRIWNKGEKEKGRDRALAGIDLARPLVAKGPGFGSAFAQWIRTPVSGYLAETGKHDQAIALLGEAVTTYRRNAQLEPQKLEHKFNEADALVWQGTRIWNKGEKDKGRDKALEGIAVARALAPKAAGFAAGFAQWIRTPVSGYLAETGKHDEAIALLGEAISTYRQLSQQEPQKFEYKLNEADALVWQGYRMFYKGDKDKGRDKTLEGVNLARTLVAKGPGYATAFAQWIRMPASGFLADTGKHDEAIALLGEAISTYRQLAQQDPQQPDHKLHEADALVWQGIRTWNKGDKAGGLTKVQEGHAAVRAVALKGPSYADHLATWLLNPGTDYAVGNGKKPEAVTMAKEAVEIYTRLTAADAKYQAKLDAAKQKLTALQG
ncbi:tetratricopeptide repeat protein [Crossiella sp. CA198]|uniref:sialidase family protein n=1 Tax=Crossiella sp. CA198 TaxID=3455607 RepID=UPI003F8D1DF6